ncbi:MAG TPA: hypothetical protein VGO47_02135 [Chlamydiales bacterium]|nr:hypothetical protein [Chlamydiales bacterium]
MNAEPLRSCPDNHTIPVLEHIISDEGWQFLVMPAWKMQWDDWLKAWEIEDYFIITTQLLEVSVFRRLCFM